MKLFWSQRLSSLFRLCIIRGVASLILCVCYQTHNMACCVVNCTNRLKRRNKRGCFGLTGKFWHPPARPPPHTCSAFAAADLDPDFMFMRVFVTGGLVLTQEKSFAAWLLWEAPQKSTASLHRLHLGHRSVPGVSEWKWLLFVHYSLIFWPWNGRKHQTDIPVLN